jgi:hypothetical protein
VVAEKARLFLAPTLWGGGALLVFLSTSLYPGMAFMRASECVLMVESRLLMMSEVRDGRHTKSGAGERDIVEFSVSKTSIRDAPKCTGEGA